jgi:hypothetical protein
MNTARALARKPWVRATARCLLACAAARLAAAQAGEETAGCCTPRRL